MAPNIYNGDFHKTLYDVQEVIPKTTEINQKTFISRNRLYKLTEYQVVGSSSYNGFIQIEFYNFGEGLKDIYSYFDRLWDNKDGIFTLYFDDEPTTNSTTDLMYKILDTTQLGSF